MCVCVRVCVCVCVCVWVCVCVCVLMVEELHNFFISLELFFVFFFFPLLKFCSVANLKFKCFAWNICLEFCFDMNNITKL